MKVLIFGPNGMLGRTLVRLLSADDNISVITLSRNDIDLSDCTLMSLKNAVSSIAPDFVVNCAGVIKQRQNIPIHQMVQVNTLVPLWLEDISMKLGCKFIHFTTDCVYDGQTGSYDEMSEHSARDAYGMSKSLGEPSGSITIRSSIIGEEATNKLSLLEVVRGNAGKKMLGYTNHIWNGMTCLEAAKLIKRIIHTPDLQYVGVRHFYSNSVSKYNLISIINEVYSLEIEVIPHLATNQIDRTLTSIYKENRMVTSIKEQVEEQMLFWKS